MLGNREDPSPNCNEPGALHTHYQSQLQGDRDRVTRACTPGSGRPCLIGTGREGERETPGEPFWTLWHAQASESTCTAVATHAHSKRTHISKPLLKRAEQLKRRSRVISGFSTCTHTNRDPSPTNKRSFLNERGQRVMSSWPGQPKPLTGVPLVTQSYSDFFCFFYFPVSLHNFWGVLLLEDFPCLLNSPDTLSPIHQMSISRNKESFP